MICTSWYGFLCYYHSWTYRFAWTSIIKKSSKQKDKWIESMNEEMSSLRKNKTWELVSKPKDQRVFGCKWKFKLKDSRPKQSNVKYKSRLVAKRFTQIRGCWLQWNLFSCCQTHIYQTIARFGHSVGSRIRTSWREDYFPSWWTRENHIYGSTWELYDSLQQK